MSRILVDEFNLNNALAVFKKALRREGDVSIKKLKDSHYFRDQEGYKDPIYEAAQLKLKEGKWEKSVIGQGKLISTVISAIQVPKNNLITSFHGGGKKGLGYYVLYKLQEGNLSRRHDFETLLYQLYKDPEGLSDEDIFTGLRKFSGKYPLLAYLFFIKDCSQYLPISPANFDFVFNKLGINFKTSGKCSWSNYKIFIDLIRQVQKFLCDNVSASTSLLDAHSFLWILKQEYKTPHAIKSLPEAILKAFEKYAETGEDFLSQDDIGLIEKEKHALIWQGSFYSAEQIYEIATGKKVTNNKTIREMFDFFKKYKIKMLSRQAAVKSQHLKYQEEQAMLAQNGFDKTAEVTVRREQAYLRRTLLKKRKNAPCAFCGEIFSRELLIAAHIKRRSNCSNEERSDIWNVAVLACAMGCDSLFEKGFVGVSSGKYCVCSNIHLPGKVNTHLKGLDGKTCKVWTEKSKKYFAWHYRNVFLKRKRL